MKNFDDWNHHKKNTENQLPRKIICRKRQIWWTKIGENLGNEISREPPFIRPVLILNHRLGGDLVLIVPITSKNNENLGEFFHKIEINGRISFVAINQIRAMSKKRLTRNFDIILDKKEFEIILKKTRNLLQI